MIERVDEAILTGGLGGYVDLSDFVATAVRNQLELELMAADGAGHQVAFPGVAAADGAPDLSLLVSGAVELEPVASASLGEALFVLTNRLSPMAMSVRVLANLAAEEWPSLDHFLAVASTVARALGHKLEREDRDARRGAQQRRYIGWPVGADEHKALGRFRWSFLLADTPPTQGPLAECGLAAVVDGHAALTSLGVELAAAPSPLLGETTGWTLGPEQQDVLRRALLAMPGESREIAIFLQAVNAAEGAQPKIDDFIQAARSEWTPNRTTAH